MKINLNGKWTMQSQSFQPMEAQIPGSVLSTLLAHERIKDPFYGANEKQARDCLQENYTFYRSFSLTQEQLNKHNYLFIDGIDTVAKLYINDKLIAELYDMHTQKRILLDNAQLSLENQIRVEFFSVYHYIENYPDKEKFATFAVTHPNGPVIRKSHHMLGWDWGPDLADMGIYRDIYILSTELGYMDSFRHECTFLPDGSVKVDVDAEIYCHTEGTVTATLSLAEDGTCQKVTQNMNPVNKFFFLLKEPKLWYPVGFGAPTLYDLVIRLTAQSGEEQEYRYRIGIRQVEIDNTPDEYGTNFCVRINGEKVFLKGSNYIPEDNILSRADKSRGLRLLQLVKDFNHNVIRVWGGGYFPDRWFYDYCDENGILVWQDLMFACASYNVRDEHFKALIIEETVDAVKRFRHHACVFYIAGDNECEDGVNGHDPELMENYRIMSQDILVPLMKKLTSTFYAYTSPHSKKMFCMQNDHDHFDTHYWGVRDGHLPLEQFKEVYPRMLSEVGHESLPMYDTICRYFPESARELYSPEMVLHEKRPNGHKTVEYYVNERYGIPERFEDFIYIHHLVQGEAIKLCAEHLRTSKFRCNGILYWQLNDCWPGLSCSSVDYCYGLKALHYFSKKFFAPHLITADEKDGNLVVSVANDTPKKGNYRVLYRYMRFDGTVLERRQINASVEKTDCKDVLSIPSPFDPDRKDTLVHVLLTDMEGKLLSENVYQHHRDREIQYPKVNIQLKQIDAYTVELVADGFAKNVYVQHGGSDTVFSDNYFHLLKGEPKRICCASKMEPEKISIISADQVKYRQGEEK